MAASDFVPISNALTVWLVEMICDIVFLAQILVALFGRSSGNSLAGDLLLGLGLSSFFILASGYFAATALLSEALRKWSAWTYPFVSAVLFAGHEQIFFKGRQATDASDVRIQITKFNWPNDFNDAKVALNVKIIRDISPRRR